MAGSFAVNGALRPRTNPDPSQSRLVAQLADQIGDGRKVSSVIDEQTFLSLLEELQATEDEHLNTSGASQSHHETSHKLLYVILKAGLEPLRRGDPFAVSTETSDRVTRSLNAIKLTISRCPNALYLRHGASHSERTNGLPMFVMLVAASFLIMVSEKIDESVKVLAEELLITMCSAEAKVTSNDVRRRFVSSWILDCLQDLVLRCERRSSDSGLINDAYPFQFPGDAILFSVCAVNDGTIDKSELYTVSIESQFEANSIAIRLLRVLSRHGLRETRKQSMSEKYPCFCPLILSNFLKIWRSIALIGDAERRDFLRVSLKPISEITSMLSEHLWCGENDRVFESRSFNSLIGMVIIILESFPTSHPNDQLVFVILRCVKSVLQKPRKSFALLDSVLNNTRTFRRNLESIQGYNNDLLEILDFVLGCFDGDIKDLDALSSSKVLPLLENNTLRERFHEVFGVNPLASGAQETSRPQKRLRVLSGHSQSHIASKDPFSELVHLMKMEKTSNLKDMQACASQRFADLSEPDQSRSFYLLGQVSCYRARIMNTDSTSSFIHKDCVPENQLLHKDRVLDIIEAEDLVDVFVMLTKLSRSYGRRGPRITSMIALRHILCHLPRNEIFNMRTSPVGQICLSGLSSSIREIRIYAGQILPLFLANDLGFDLAARNRILSLDLLRKLSDEGELSQQETCILSWSEVIRSLGDGDELNFALLKVIEYLGHPNSFLCGVAYDQLQMITNHSPYTALKFLASYWRTIAVVVVQDMHRRPQMIQQLAELLGMNVAKRDIVQRIAEASNVSIVSLCREHNNMAAILAYILLETPVGADAAITETLNRLSPEFHQVDCSEVLKAEPQTTAAELLKMLGDGDDSRRAKAQEAIEFLAEITHGKNLSGRGSRRTDKIEIFFEVHVLGIVALLADAINDGKGPQPLLEKIRCICAIREMITIGKSSICNGLPQVSACLRSAMEQKDLANEGFQAWMIMVTTLSEDDIAPLIDPTFAMMVQYWDSFHPSIQLEAYNMIGLLLRSHQNLLRENILCLPSLSTIPVMSKFDEEIERLKAQMDVKHHFSAYCKRLKSENATVIERALQELCEYLERTQSFLHQSASNEQSDPVVGQLIRALLDIAVLLGHSNPSVATLCGRCLGRIGCIDSTRVEAAREKKDILVLSNFSRDDEIRDFVLSFLQEVLIKAFMSATNSRSQGFLAFGIQELLAIADFGPSVNLRSRDSASNNSQSQWSTLPETTRAILTPFLDSKYFVTAGVQYSPCQYPYFKESMTHPQWLRAFSFDLLKKDVGHDSVRALFSVLSRIIRSQDTSIAGFLLPFVLLNTVINGDDTEKSAILKEMLHVLAHPLPDGSTERSNVLACCQTIFVCLDYLSRWLKEKRKEVSSNKNTASTRSSRAPTGSQAAKDILDISSVEAVVSAIPADMISRRAVDCRSYARALYHWEQYIRQSRDMSEHLQQGWDSEPYYARLQEVYTQIDEPDGLDGISAHLQVLNIDQQILEHRKSGRWMAAQSWYEMQLYEQPKALDTQINLLLSLKESGQHDILLNQFESLDSTTNLPALVPYAMEASWVVGKWNHMKKLVERSPPKTEHFNLEMGRALAALSEVDNELALKIFEEMQRSTIMTLSSTNTSTLQECHEAMLKFHALAEVESIGLSSKQANFDKNALLGALNERLEVLGPFPSDKQYVLGLRRAAMQLTRDKFSRLDTSGAWLKTAKLARKAGLTHQAFSAVLHASKLGDASATMEHARLLWREGSHRKAIRTLEGAIAANAFRQHDYTELEDAAASAHASKQPLQNLLKAKAHLLLAKWVDRAGQTQSDVIIGQYKKAVEFHQRWERGHYHLGRHYYKLFESEKSKPPPKQAQTFISGETAKLVVENYLRSLAFGAKYIYQTLPRILTLWLDLGNDAEQSLDPKYGNDETFRSHTMLQRRKLLGACNSQIKKYVDRLPAWVFYTALPQIVARICHPNQTVYTLLVDIVAKVMMQHPAQALWMLLAMLKSSSKDRANRGVACMTRTYEISRRAKNEATAAELKAFISQAQKLSDQLLRVCEADVMGRLSSVSLSKDLGFSHKTPIPKLALPVEACLTASLPSGENVSVKQHKAFNTHDYVHISSFLDDVLILSSLQRPRKIKIRGSDGRVYAMLCKPKDDLRKDQRLMEFNSMINRALKKDPESSKRRLYIKTYAVTPLNETCGLIEWVDNLKTLREILLNGYKQKHITINYNEIRSMLDEAISDKKGSKLPIFTQKLLPHFKPVFHEWFVDMFPEPGSWFNARLRYTRSCAVMSIVGHVLGLGDRHGENILFEEGNGGTLHVDFNCLFDKGLTFEKPELVPFRLTHNMVDAFGAYGYEGPFRRSCELSNSILRQHEDTLMTILETFVYDPTTDFIGKKKKRDPIVPDTPEGVLESVRNKVRGLLPGESVPLSVEGYVEALIAQSTDPFKLASMYIGWCAFF